MFCQILRLAVDEKQKIALVGKNGAGKSTFLKIIANIIDEYEGEVKLTNNRTIAYLPQDVPFDTHTSGLEYIQEGMDTPPHIVAQVLTGLGVPNDVVKRPFIEMSGGQRSKVLLTKFLLQKTDILLLDEPTNNLDIQSIIWLENFLKASSKAMIIISHDITFINNVTNKVAEITQEGTLQTSRGTYGDYLERQEKEFAKQRAEYKKYQVKKLQIEQQIDSIQDKAQLIKEYTKRDNDKMAGDRKKGGAEKGMQEVQVLRSKLDQLTKEELPVEIEPLTITMNPTIEENIIIEAEEVIAGREGGITIGPLSFFLKPGSRICIMGENGSGKSTLLNTILGTKKLISGNIQVGSQVIFGDVMQEHNRTFVDESLLTFFMSETKANETEAHNTLQKYGIAYDTFNDSVKNLSTGTRARLLFAIFSLTHPNTLILDEPTNHLDIESVRALKLFLKEFKGIVILVSHNRWFIDSMHIDTFYEVYNGAVKKIEDFHTFVEVSQKRSLKMVRDLKRLLHQ